MTTNNERTKGALELAAASPDPAVRQLALHYKSMVQELEALDGFFAVYYGAGAAAVPAQAPTRIASNGAAPPAPAARKIAVAQEIQDILAARGPLDMDALRAAYVAKNPDDADRTREQIRLSVARHPDRFKRVSTEDRRVCLANGAPPPGGEHVPLS